MIEQTRRDFVKKVSVGAMGLATSQMHSAFATPWRNSRVNKTGYIYDARYLDHPGNGTECPARLVEIQKRLTETSIIKDLTALRFHPDPVPFIKLIHSENHVASIKKLEDTGMVAELAVAGALGAAQAVCERVVDNAFCAIRPPGHHAHSNGGEEGFCFYNNVAITAKFLQKNFDIERILIIDWDFHHGNGTMDAFYEDPSVLFFSTHDMYAYPGTGDPAKIGEGAGEGYTINVHLDYGATDETMFRAWEDNLLAKADKFKPQFVLISAGFDSRMDDLLGNFNITDYGFSRITKMAMDIANTHGQGRLLSMLEGGYNITGLAMGVAAHIGTLIKGDVETSTKGIKKSSLFKLQLSDRVITITLDSSIRRRTISLTIRNAAGAVVYEMPAIASTNGIISINTKDLKIGQGIYWINVKTDTGRTYSRSCCIIG